MKRLPLKYKISSWYQITQCLSNNSKALHLRVTDFINNPSLKGIKISVEHDTLGTLFAYVVEPEGKIVSKVDDSGFTTDQLLRQLAVYGFLIEFAPELRLSFSQIEYLITLDKLGFDKLRRIGVQVDPTKPIPELRIVGFNVKKLPEWLHNTYALTPDELSDALVNGYAIDITEISRTQKYCWDWLDYVANITDIISDATEAQSWQ